MIKIPQHKKLYELLRRHIEEGVYKTGDILPSENDLCKLHNLTRPTVRQALNNLAYDGYIIKQQGKGSIVNNPPKGIGILSVSGTTSAIGRNKLSTRILLKPGIRKWEQPFIFSLTERELESGCIYFERLRYIEGKPVFYDISYLPNINLPRFTSRKLENASLFDILRKFYDIQIKGGEQRLRAISAHAKISDYLDLAEGSPVLHLERRMATNKMDFHIYSSIYCNTEIEAIYGTF